MDHICQNGQATSSPGFQSFVACPILWFLSNFTNESLLGILHCFVVVGLFVWAEWPEVYSCDMDVENILEMSLKDWHHILAFAFLDLNKASNY